MIADEHKEGRVVAFSTVENETSTPVELELSARLPALQLLLTLGTRPLQSQHGMERLDRREH